MPHDPLNYELPDEAKQPETEEVIVEAPADESFATRAELLKTRNSVARSVKRLNAAIKAAREKTPEPEPLPSPLPTPPPPKKHSDVTKLGLRFLDSCRRKGK